jgi:hypothetical protein
MDGDVTGMRTATTRAGAAFVTAAFLAAAGIASGQMTAQAEPAGHQVVYRLTTGGPTNFDLFYLTTQPPSMQAYNADAYAFVKREAVFVGPDAPWEFTTTLADPEWAIFTVSSTTRGGQAAPNARCEIVVDGQVRSDQTAPYNPRCQLGQW